MQERRPSFHHDRGVSWSVDLLGFHHVPGPVLGTEDALVDKTGQPQHSWHPLTRKEEQAQCEKLLEQDWGREGPCLARAILPPLSPIQLLWLLS